MKKALLTLTLMLVIALAMTLANAQVYTDLHNFDNTDGRAPGIPGILAQGRDGNFYGTTALGGISDNGVVFRITPSGELTVLHRFNGADGSQPNGGLTLGTDGNFYGVTGAGGGSGCIQYGCGTIFKITPSGVLTSLYNFGDGSEGVAPNAPPIQGSDGSFYGTTTSVAYAYKITAAGAFTLLTGFIGPPYGPLFQASDGNFYGMTYDGGSDGCFQEGCGTVFKMTPNGTVTTLYIFDGTHGAGPYSSLIQINDSLYGTTAAGGSHDKGAVFRLTPKGIEVLQNLGGNHGGAPSAGLVQASDGNLYGVAANGGTLGYGVIFQITSAGYAVLYDFDGADGQLPESELVQHTNGKLYGMTAIGGTSSDGVVYSFDLGLPPFVRLVSGSGRVGATGGILGQGFTGTTSVSINGIPAAFTVVSDTYLTATVPAGATTGFVTVVTPSGTLTSNQQFNVRP